MVLRRISMYFEKVKVDFPIPSCQINKLIWDEKEKKWFYEYIVKNKSKTKLSPSNKKELFVYSHISNLTIAGEVNENSINIVVYNIEDIIELMKKQAKSDMEYREKWIEEHDDYYDNVLKFTTKNKTFSPEYRFVINILEQNDEETTFIMSY